MTEINNDIRIQKLQQKLDDVLLKIKINQSILMREMSCGPSNATKAKFGPFASGA